MRNDNKRPQSDKMPPTVAKAYGYYLKGLTSAETGKLLDVSPRTVQRWTVQYQFEQTADPDPLPVRALRLYQSGHTYAAIAKAIGKSRTTVYYYIRDMRKMEKAH